MAEARDYILTVERHPEAAQEYVLQLSHKLQSKQTSLVDVVQSLGEYINDDDPSIREKAVKLLVQLVASLPTQFLSRQQISVLCDFLCDRIEDGNALNGLRTLSQLSRFTGEMAISVFRALCIHYSDLKTRPQSVRYEALILLNTLMATHRSSIRSMDLESLTGVLDLVAGERDPRNLMVVFSSLAVLISEWDISLRVEDVFDSVFCYFPITFRPPPNDPYGITAQDLKQRLQNCLAASRLFAAYVFPQLIDKLDSTAINAKRDVLRAISACSASYGSTTMSKYSVNMWDSLKFEIFNAQEEELADEALSSLVSLAKCLNGIPEVHDTGAHLAEFLEPVSKECNERLLEPQQKQAQPAAKIVGALAATSHPALTFLVQTTLPPLLTLYQEADSFEMRRAILSAVSVLLLASTELKPSSTEAVSSPLLPFNEKLSDIHLQAIMHTGTSEISLRHVAIENLTYLCLSPGLLNVSEVNLVGRHLCEIVIQETEVPASIRSAAIHSLSTLSSSKSDLITEVVLPAIFAYLPDSSPHMGQSYRLLNALASFRLGQDLSGTLVRRLLNKATQIARDSMPAEYFGAILATVNSIMLQQNLTNEALLVFCSEKVSSLTGILIDSSTGASASLNLSWLNAPTTLGHFTCVVLRLLQDDAQQAISQKLFALLQTTSLPSATTDRYDVIDPAYIKDILRTYLFAGLRSSAPLPYSQLELFNLIDASIDRTQTGLHPLVRQHLLQQMALVVNKFLDTAQLFKVEERLWAVDRGLLSLGQLSKSSIRTGFWIVKALILRITKISDILLRLIDLLSSEVHGVEVALAFELILTPDDVLSRENGAIIRSISSQKIFSTYLAEVSKRLPNASSTDKSNYLTALAGLMKHLNNDLIMLQGESLIPLLSQALSLDSPKVQESAIRTVAVLVQGSAESLESHAPSLINRLLLSAVKVDAEMIQVRHQALIALQHFAAKVKSTVLMPYRQAVLNGIRPCLDDPKRFIRKDAVDCRSAWMSLDEPDKDAS